MKTRITNDFLSELSEDEYVTINGGESAWYWIGYGIGAASREAKEFMIDAYIFVQCNNPVI